MISISRNPCTASTSFKSDLQVINFEIRANYTEVLFQRKSYK